MSFLAGLSKYLNVLSDYLAMWGIPGLFIIALLDSAFVPLAGGPDVVILILAASMKQPASMFFWIALTATAGSTIGNMVLYGIGRKGGEKALARFNPERVARMERSMRKYGAWAILGSVLAPPPFPTKLVVLAAGVLGIGKAGFAVAVFVGRLIRYTLFAWLAAQFGEKAKEIIKEHSWEAGCVLAGAILLFLAIHLWRERSRRQHAAAQLP
ncbi:MAG: VTT domain-containing protein [Acidobacteriota bacterium]|nr:VTT domain-containing protein [Acidobacteriota bacterium]